MRLLMMLAAAITITFWTSDQAQAGRGGGVMGTSETTSFVAETTITADDGQLLSLCHMTKKTYIMFAGVWRSSIGYVVAGNRCETDEYYEIKPDFLTMAKLTGKLAQEVPDQPVMSSDEIIDGFWGLGPIGIFILFVLVSLNKRRKRAALRTGEMTGASPTAIKILDAMCHVAKADGRLDANEIALMADLSHQMTGTAFDSDRILRMYNLAETNLTPAQYKSFGKGLAEGDKRLLMTAVLMMASADGNIDKKEMQFVQKLGMGLKIGDKEVNTIFAGLNQATA